MKNSILLIVCSIILSTQAFAQNVGVHTSAPAAPFHVASLGQANVPGGLVLLGNPAAGHLELDFARLQSMYGNNPLGFSTQMDGGAIGIGMYASTYGPKLQIGHSSWHIEIQNGDDGSTNDWFVGSSDDTWAAGDDKLVISPTSSSNSANIQLHADGDVLLVPQELGKVGIGVTSIDYLPDGFLLAVDGKAIFEEARVQMSGDWPDYVFHEDYMLSPLNELEEDIAALGHLPGIPSAGEVEATGLDLGDMQRRLLEKVEELTLYAIQANKEIEVLKALCAELMAEQSSRK